jgi:hypothetical protein
MIYLCNISITEARLFLFVSKAAYACFCMHENLHACVYANLQTPMLILSMSALQKHAYAFVCMRICTHPCWCWPCPQMHVYACVWKDSSKYKRVYCAFIVVDLDLGHRSTRMLVCEKNQSSISVCIGHSTKRQKYLEQKSSVCTITQIRCLN